MGWERDTAMGLIKEPYSFLSTYSEETYDYLIKNVLDNTEEINGYKDILGNPSITTNKGIAREIFSFFLTHYFKAIDTYANLDKIILEPVSTSVNVIDVGSNIGTVTYAYIDFLISKIGKSISFNIVFVEPSSYRVELLAKSIEQYKRLSGIDIKYTIINKFYEDSVDDIIKSVKKVNTIILMSNLLTWINDITKFQSSLLNNIMAIDLNCECRAINIETKSNSADIKLIELYGNINKVKLRVNEKYKKMPSFNNIEECYYLRVKGTKVYKSPRQYCYGYIVRDKDIFRTINYDTIEKSFYKALYSARNYFLYDDLEIKYINSNLEKIKLYICNLMENEQIVQDFCYQYQMKKNKDKTRSLFIDDFINDIIFTAILITKGLVIDSQQNDKISFGNRINEEMDSPFTFKPYYIQFFDKYLIQVRECCEKYKFYFKIDLKTYYNKINHKIIKDIFDKENNLGSPWYNNMIDRFLYENLDCCDSGAGLQQGPEFSHLLSNIYLKKFDDWFYQEFEEAHMLRYVDDIILFTDSSEKCMEIYVKSENYLKTELKLEVNPDKGEKGETTELLKEKSDLYYVQIINETNRILRSLYKLDKDNFDIFINNPEEFVSTYQKCLNKLGIYISKDWINAKINKELNFLGRLKERFKKKGNWLKWAYKKDIYYKVKLGNIPRKSDEVEIDNWYDEFRVHNKNIIKKIDEIVSLLENKLNSITEQVKNNKSKEKEVKSMFKFTFSRIQIFKMKNLGIYIDDILKYFPYCNKRVLSTYNELADLIEKLLIENKKDYNNYNYAIYIWLLGEYRNMSKLNMIEEIFRISYKDKQYFINSLSTEAILKIGKPTNDLKKDLVSKINVESNYYLKRNILLLLNSCTTNNELDLLLKSIKYDDERMNLFIEWLHRNKGCKLINSLDNIPIEFKNKYPEYPKPNQYLSL